jgi:prophage regulatory protein
MNAKNSLIRLPEVRRLTGLSRSSLYRLERAGHFVPRIRLSTRACAWRFDQVTAWIEARPLADAVPAPVVRGKGG